MSARVLDGVDQRLRQLWRRLGLAGRPFPREQVRDVVLLLSSSRGGSSFLTSMLRRSRWLLHLRAEINPMLRLTGRGHPRNGTGSDALDAGHLGEPSDLDPFLWWEVGRRVDRLPAGAPRHRFAGDLYGRLTMQWPEVELDPERLDRWTGETLDELVREHGWQPGGFPDARLFLAHLLSRVRRAHPEIDPFYYDIPPAMLHQAMPDLPLGGEGPPSPELVEEPPFITPAPLVGATDLSRPLIIKTPSNVYRLPFLAALFPRARLRVLHLVRNPAASINGLYDGWCHRGFFSHRLDRPLAIAGYSDRFPDWGRSWWNFDLPPAWKEWTDLALEEVCARQWMEAHRTILRYVERSAVDRYILRFEDLVGARESRMRVMSGLCDWLGVGPEGMEEVISHGLPPVMATRPPAPARWRRRAGRILPLIESGEVQTTARRLGYREASDEWL
jgi:hypothetical protein